MTVKAIVGYGLAPGITREEYDRWLHEVHVPDLFANPHLDAIVFNTVVEPVATTSGTTDAPTQEIDLYRVAELHFADLEQYRLYREWFDAHPIPPERSPAGRSAFRFYVLCETMMVTPAPAEEKG
jgi:hypothetical protein